MIGGWLSALATLVATMGPAAFPAGDYPGVTWRIDATAPVTYDAQTGVLIYTAVPSAWVGCAAPRFTVDTASETVLAVHCAEAGGYRLLFE